MASRVNWGSGYSSPKLRPAEMLFGFGSRADAAEFWEFANAKLRSHGIPGPVSFAVVGAPALAPMPVLRGLPAGAAAPMVMMRQQESEIVVTPMGGPLLIHAPLHPLLERPLLGKALEWVGWTKWRGFENVQMLVDKDRRMLWRSDFHAARVFLLPSAAALAALACGCWWLARRGAVRRDLPTA